MSLSSNSLEPDEARNGSHPWYAKCPVCKGSGIDPASAKSHQDDEWDCTMCEGYGDIEVWDD